MLVAGTIQGLVVFADLCDDKLFYYDKTKVTYLHFLKYCYLLSAQDTDDDGEANFITIITLSSVATLWWVS